MQDRRIARIDRQLGSVIVVLNAAASEAESLSDQALADDLHKQLYALKRIHAAIPQNGRKYKPL